MDLTCEQDFAVKPSKDREGDESDGEVCGPREIIHHSFESGVDPGSDKIDDRLKTIFAVHGRAACSKQISKTRLRSIRQIGVASAKQFLRIHTRQAGGIVDRLRQNLTAKSIALDLDEHPASLCVYAKEIQWPPGSSQLSSDDFQTLLKKSGILLYPLFELSLSDRIRNLEPKRTGPSYLPQSDPCHSSHPLL